MDDRYEGYYAPKEDPDEIRSVAWNVLACLVCIVAGVVFMFAALAEWVLR